MFRSLLCLTLLASLFTTPAISADNQTEQLRAGFDASYFNQFKTVNPEGFARVEALMVGMREYLGVILPVQIEVVRTNTDERKARPAQAKLEALLACSDLPPNFTIVKSRTTITADAAVTHRLALQKCKMAHSLLAPFLNKHPGTMNEWLRLAGLVELPRGIDLAAAGKAYNADINARYEAALSNGAVPANNTAQAPQTAGDSATFNTNSAAPALPAAPYSFNWDEIAMIRTHATWALDTYDAESRLRYGLQQCTAMLDAPKGAYAAYTTINSWAEQCGKQIAIGLDDGYGENFQDFGKHYRAAFISFEEKMQKNNVGHLAPLPTKPYQFQPVEIERYRDYMRAASNSSLLLLARLENTSGLASLNPGDVCGSTDPSLLKTDLSNPFVMDNWKSYMGRLVVCAKDIQRAYPLAGNPLMASLKEYRAALQAKPVGSFFN